MASLLKNQILKHLSKFTKNLSPDKLQLSAFKGSFEVNNIELNEKVLMELLELPVWMSLTKAHCNYASIKIQWMKLKTVPIYIMLDEVVIEAETCENFRAEADPNNANKLNLNQETGSYGFTNKVIDGITLSINSVVTQFSSKIFSASFELTRITIESRNCIWKKVDDLSKTRIRDQGKGQVLLFKHIEWQTLRFVAKSEINTAVGQAPLRLIANQTSCRITLKKRISDSALLGARIMVIFDDLLWVLTDSQLLSALHFADYLGGLIKRAPRTKVFDQANDSKSNQQAKAKLMNLNASSPTKKPQATPITNTITTLFNQYDFLETSYHLIVRRIEVHLMDDLGPQSERSQCPELSEGGALQMTFLKLLIDLYPYQSVSGSRKHWFRYNEPSANRQSFINHKLKTFYMKQQNTLKSEGSNFNLQSLQYHLLSRVLVIRLSDYSIGCVSTNSSNKSARNNNNNRNEAEPIKLISFDQSALIPGNVNPIYVELNSYFYVEPFDKLDLPLPDTNIFASVAPVRINFDPLTILWINAFFANLRSALIKLQEAFPKQNASEEKVNLRAEILMPTVVLNLNSNNSEDDSNNDYSAIEVKISRILIYNCDSYIQPEYFKSLENLLKYFSANLDFYFEKTRYPWLSCDMKSISNEFVHQITRWFASKSHEDSLSPKFDIDFWTVSIEPLWIEFKSPKLNRNESFLEPINITLYLHPASENDNSGIDMNIFAQINDPVKVQINHKQLLCLLRLLERIGNFTSMLDYDTYMIQRLHYKRDFENSSSDLCSFDIDEKVLKAIFKSSAIVTSVPEVNLFLMLKEEELELPDEIFSPEKEDLNQIFSTELTNSQPSSPIQEEPSEELVNYDNHEHAPVYSSEPPVFSSDTSFEHISFNSLNHNSESGHGSSNGTSSPVVLSKPNSANNIPSLAGSNSFSDNGKHHLTSSSRKGTLLNASSFDSGVKFHYNCDNDDAISTFSDISQDDSDQQSFIAMMNDGMDNVDDIFPNNEVEVAEVAEEMSENFKLTNGDEDDTLNDSLIRASPLINTTKRKAEFKDVLQVRLNDLNIIHQSSKGFLSQVFLDTSHIKIDEHPRMTKANYLNLHKAGHIESNQGEMEEEAADPSMSNDKMRLTLRIDSFNKGTLRDEMISVRVQNLAQTLNKETIDLVVDFFNDPVADKPAPTAILLENVKIKIIDTTVQMPPPIFTLPKLKLSRNKENKWIVDLDSSLPKDSPLYNQLLLMHLKIFERNLLFDVKDLIKEQDRLISPHKHLLGHSEGESQQILEQVLNQKELLLQELELLRKENAELRTRIRK